MKPHGRGIGNILCLCGSINLEPGVDVTGEVVPLSVKKELFTTGDT